MHYVSSMSLNNAKVHCIYFLFIMKHPYMYIHCQAARALKQRGIIIKCLGSPFCNIPVMCGEIPSNRLYVSKLKENLRDA